MMELATPRRVLFGLVVFLAVGLHALGITVRTVNLSEMVGMADRVFVGKCVELQPVDLGLGLQVTEYAFQVSRGLVGVNSGDKVVFRQVTGSSRRGRGIAGFPGLKKGQEILLFLYPDSKLGLTSPVGVHQGVFSIRQDAEETLVVNSIDNSNLGFGLSLRQAELIGLNQEEAGMLSRAGPVPLRQFEGSVRKMERFHRGKGKQPQ